MSKKQEETKELKDITGIGDATFRKLATAGFDSFEACAYSTPKKIREQSGVGEETAKKVYWQSYYALKLGEPKTGTEILEEENNRRNITTGVQEFDDLLGGAGIRSKEITGASGKFSAGKSALGMQLVVNSMLPEERGGLGEKNKVVFYDSESTFSANRIVQMAEAKGLDAKKVLSNIIYYRLDNSLAQIEALKGLEALYKEHDIGLVVVDSLMFHFRNDYIGRENLAERQQLINKYLHVLHRFAIKHNACVYLTNQIVSNPNALFGNPDKMIGGNIVGHMLNPNIWLRKTKDDIRKARIVDSSDLPDSEGFFRVTDKGLEKY